MEWLQLGIVLVLASLWYPLYGRKVYRRWQAFKAWEATHGEDQHKPPASPLDPTYPAMLTDDQPLSLHIDTTVLAGAGTALAKPPRDLRVDLHEMLTKNGTDPYSFPIGWCREGDKPSLVHAALINDVNHILLTGLTDCGKDAWARNMLLSLALLNTPEKVKFAIIDGKGGLSWIGWETKQHVWLMAESTEDIPRAMQALKQERERRQQILKQARCEKWDEYSGTDLPLIVVFVSELMLLQDATSKSDLADWLNTELTSARAAGIRYIVSSQTVTRMDTRWRSQIGLYVAGYQAREDADEPNTNLSTKDLVRFGTTTTGAVVGVPPSALPMPPDGQGVFTCIQGRTIMTVRGTYVNSQQKEWLLSKLPEKPLQEHRQPVPPVAAHDPMLAALLTGASSMNEFTRAKSAIAHSNATKAPSERYSDSTVTSVKSGVIGAIAPALVSAEAVPVEEQQRILAAAPTVKSRRQLSQKLYAVTGGPKYTWVQKVCDAAGLFVKEQAA